MSIEVTGRDLSQWVRGGIVSVTRQKGVLFSVDAVGHRGDDSVLSGFIIKEGQGIPERKRYKNTSVSLWWPTIGCVNITRFNITFGVYVYRLAHRQWRRTYHSEFLRTSVPREWDVEVEMGGRAMPNISCNDHDVILALSDPKYPTTEDALRCMTEDTRTVSLAVSPNTVLYYDGHPFAGFLVYYKDEYVGDLYKKTMDGRVYLQCHKAGTLEDRLSESLGVPVE